VLTAWNTRKKLVKAKLQLTCKELEKPECWSHGKLHHKENGREGEGQGFPISP